MDQKHTVLPQKKIALLMFMIASAAGSLFSCGRGGMNSTNSCCNDGGGTVHIRGSFAVSDGSQTRSVSPSDGNISITVNDPSSDITVDEEVLITMPTGTTFTINETPYANTIPGLTVKFSSSVSQPTINGSLDIAAATTGVYFNIRSDLAITRSLMCSDGTRPKGKSIRLDPNAQQGCVVIGAVVDVGKTVTMMHNRGCADGFTYYAGVTLLSGGAIRAVEDIEISNNTGCNSSAGVGGPAGITGDPGTIESTTGSIFMNYNVGGGFIQDITEGHPGPNITAAHDITMNNNTGDRGAGVGGGYRGAGGAITAAHDIIMNNNTGGDGGAGVGGGAGGAGGAITAAHDIMMNNNTGGYGAGVGGGHRSAGGNITAAHDITMNNNTGGARGNGGAGVGGGGNSSYSGYGCWCHYSSNGWFAGGAGGNISAENGSITMNGNKGDLGAGVGGGAGDIGGAGGNISAENGSITMEGNKGYLGAGVGGGSGSFGGGAGGDITANNGGSITGNTGGTTAPGGAGVGGGGDYNYAGGAGGTATGITIFNITNNAGANPGDGQSVVQQQ